MKTHKGIAGLVGVLTGLVGSPVPDTLRTLLLVLTGAIILDTLVGVYCAALAGRVWSRTIYTMLVTKLVQYTICAGLALGVTLLVRQWHVMTACLTGLLTIEALSLIETATKLQKHGVRLGPMSGFFRRVTKYLSDEATEVEGKEKTA